MVALFGEGRHPNADQIERDAQLAGRNPQQVDQASRLGAPYRIHEQANMFHRRSAGAFRDHNTVIHAVEKIQRQMGERQAIYEQVTDVLQKLKLAPP